MRLDYFNDELLHVGGRHPNGMPRLRCVSALTETKWACGGWKIKYVANSRTEERWLWGLRDKDTGETWAKSEADVIANADPQLYAVRKLLSREVTWTGWPNFVIEYYSSVDELKETPANWFTNRYGWWKNPSTKLVEWTDINGEFPVDGRYDLFMIIKHEDGTVWGKFRELDSDVLVEVSKAVYAHKNFKKPSDEQAIQKMVDDQEAKEQKVEDEIADAVEQEIGADWRRMLANNPRVFQTGRTM